MDYGLKIYLVGNEILENDAMPFLIQPYLARAFPNGSFIHFDPTEDFPEDPRPIFIDTAINLTVPRLFKNINEFEPFLTRGLSVHNFDFYTELALQEKMGNRKKYAIIAVPPEGNPKIIGKQVVKILTKRHIHFTFKK